MYGIFTNICPKNHPNVGKNTIHGAYGIYYCKHPCRQSLSNVVSPWSWSRQDGDSGPLQLPDLIHRYKKVHISSRYLWKNAIHPVEHPGNETKSSVGQFWAFQDEA